jgi:hypothetical protein
MFTHDLKVEVIRQGSPALPEQARGLHNALEDARWNKETYDHLRTLREPHRGS